MTDPTHTPWRRLACAYLVRALRDASDPTDPDLLENARDARAWLASEEARGLLLALGYDPAHLDRLLGNLPDLPPEPCRQLALAGFSDSEGFLHYDD